MKVLVVVDGHLGMTPDGVVWSEKIYNYDFFKRYLEVFDEVRIAMRIKQIENNIGYPNLCSGKGVEFFTLPEFKGPKEYVMKYLELRRLQMKAYEGCECAIFRIPSTVGYQLLNGYRKLKKPYAIEVVVDPWDLAAPGRLKTILRPYIRMAWTHSLKKICKKANGVSYVTKSALQKRYPSKSRTHGESENWFESYYSSVLIKDDFLHKSRVHSDLSRTCRVIHITNDIGNYVKGHSELLYATEKLKEIGIEIKVEFIGDGKLIEEFEQLAKDLAIYNQISFRGRVSNKEEIRNLLINSDLFVFPSHAEGLPRVVIEAMAVGLPVVSTNVNGIPELIDNEYLVKPGEINELVYTIRKLILHPELMDQQSKRNFNKSKKYTESKLRIRRNLFYNKLRRLASN